MESIVKSQLTGKWYQIAKGENRRENDFVEVLLYLSDSCGDNIDLLYVGIGNGGSKKLKKLSLKILTDVNFNYLIVGGMFFRKKLKILTFDYHNGIIVVADKKMRCFSILSKKPIVSQDVVEKTLCKIDFSCLGIDNIKLFSDKIV